MRKGTIFKYELRRLFLSKEYLLLLAVSLAYCISLLRGSVIYGTFYSAPFSQRTFCGYVSSVTVLLLVMLLALCARQFTASERGALAIIDTTPIPVPVFLAIRYAAIMCAFLIVVALAFGICFIFYWLVFDYTAFGKLIRAGLLLLLPSALLIFGAAILLGNKKPVLIYVLLAAVLIVGVFGIYLPTYIDVIGNSVTQPLYNGVQNFAFSYSFIIGRVVFTIAGILFIILSLTLSKKKLHR